MNTTNRIVGGVAIVVLTAASWTVPAWSAETSRTPDVAKGEASQQKSQQGIGLEGGGSSNVILGGPEIIFGKIAGIQGDEFMIEGDRGQFIRLRATKDPNMVCNEGQGAKLSSSRQGRVEASDMGTATTIQELSAGERARIAGRESDQPQQ